MRRASISAHCLIKRLIRWQLSTGLSHRLFSTTLDRRTTWGFIGLGRMGFPIARNLRKQIGASDRLIVHDMNTEASQRLIKESEHAVEVARTPREVAECSETVFTALPETSHVKDVFETLLRPKLASLHDKERLFVDLSTIDPASSRQLALEVHQSKTGIFVDAPMSGGVVGAENATLTFMFGASDSAVERTKSCLSKLGKSAIHCGDNGLGLSAKLANNYLLAISNIATAEAMNLGIKWGLDPELLARLINTSSGRCWSSEVNNPVPGVVSGAPSSKGYQGGFGVTLMKKDLKLAIEAANQAGAQLQLQTQTLKVYEEVSRDPELKGKDFSVVYKYLGGS